MPAFKAITGRVLRINLSEKTYNIEPLPEKYIKEYLGGRGFNIRRLLDEVPPDIDPLGPENKLIFGTGPLVGTSFPGQRFNVSAKSPVTGLLGDSNAGGFFCSEMKFAGFDQIIIEGQADERTYIYIYNDRVEFRNANHLWGLDTREGNKELLAELGDNDFQIAIIGPAAENGVKYSGIFTNIVRANARTGMGAVMASKNLKAIALRGTNTIKVENTGKFNRLMRKVFNDIESHPEYESRLLMGTTRLVSSLNAYGMLNTKNHQTGVYKDADMVSGETLARKYNVKNKGCFGCTIPCSRYFKITDGPFKGFHSEGPEFESLAGFTSRILVNDLSLALKAVDLCNRYGMDTIAVSGCVSFAMEIYDRGIITKEDTEGLDLSWGNGEAVLELIEQIKDRRGFGGVLADGSKVAAEKIGKGAIDYAMQVKNSELFLGEPRGIKAYGLGNAVASRGADHLRAEPFFELLEDPELGKKRFGIPESALRLSPKGKGLVVNYFEDWCAIVDALEICKNTFVAMEILPFEAAADLLNAALGWEISAQDLQNIGTRINNAERVYNTMCGLKKEDDTLPKRFIEEPMPEECGPTAGSVFELEPMLEEYYSARGWDPETGVPRLATLKKLNLEEDVSRLKNQGIEVPE